MLPLFEIFARLRETKFDRAQSHILIETSVLSLMLLQFSTKTAEADTSSELAKKSKETFRKEVSRFLNIQRNLLYLKMSQYPYIFAAWKLSKQICLI